MEPGRGILRFVDEQFGAVPDSWQEKALELFSSDKPEHQRIALQACVGPGKSAVLAMAGLWFISTKGTRDEPPKGLCTSITEGNLKANLWAEYAKWLGRSPYLSSAFTWTSSRVFANDFPEKWFIEARSWPKRADPDQQGNTFSGLHAKYVMAQIDESGAVPPSILRAAEQALSRCEFGKVIQAGNPVSLEGMLYFAATRLRSQWNVIKITGNPEDPKAWVNSKRLEPAVRERAITWARQQIATYGLENPWVKSYILGEFPPASINALFSIEDIDKAIARKVKPEEYEHMQKRLGVDVARFGDDLTVGFPRQGMYAGTPWHMRNVRTTDIAARVMESERRWNPRPGGNVLVLVDDTGHWGHGVIDNLLTAGRNAIPIIYSDKAIDPRYKNRRAEMYFGFSDWVKFGRLPNHPELIEEMTAITYTFVQGQMMLEDKDLVKVKIGRSPNFSDALAQTFALPDMPADVDELPGTKRHTRPGGGRARRMDDNDPSLHEDVGRAIRDKNPYEDD
jgi:hypothetical protein